MDMMDNFYLPCGIRLVNIANHYRFADREVELFIQREVFNSNAEQREGVLFKQLSQIFLPCSFFFLDNVFFSADCWSLGHMSHEVVKLGESFYLL